MSQTVRIRPLEAAAFAPFGDVLDATGTPDKVINQGRCGRFHDLAQLDFSDGAAGISLFSSEPVSLPYRLEMVERHPEGSQAFLPMTQHPFLVIAAPDEDGRPGRPKAFLTGAGQGINLYRATWHGVLTPLHTPGLFTVVDRIGPGQNLEEFWYDNPYIVE